MFHSRDGGLTYLTVTHDQLDYYLDEFTFRFNRRRSRHRGLLFYRLLEGALAVQPAPYKTLISPGAASTSDPPANPP